jgi:hypothetical protein
MSLVSLDWVEKLIHRVDGRSSVNRVDVGGCFVKMALQRDGIEEGGSAPRKRSDNVVSAVKESPETKSDSRRGRKAKTAGDVVRYGSRHD